MSLKKGFLSILMVLCILVSSIVFALPVGAAPTGTEVVNYALQFVGNPYVYGGSSLTHGTDCSGFVMSVYNHFGYSLPHASASMRYVGSTVPSLSAAVPGDIIYWYGHVALYMGGGRIVHAKNSYSGIVTDSVYYSSAPIISIRRVIGSVNSGGGTPNYNDSNIVVAPVLQPASTPTLDAKNALGGKKVQISSSTSGASIYYTTDGSTPTSQSERYTKSFLVKEDCTVRAIAVKDGYLPSSEGSLTLTVDKVENPKVKMKNTITGKTVTLSCETEDAVLYYTLDGSKPTTKSKKYKKPFALTQVKKLRVAAAKKGMATAYITEDCNLQKVAAPMIAVQKQNDSKQITLSTESKDALIYYTLDGSEPTTESFLYQNMFTVNANQTVRAMAVKSGYLASEITTKEVRFPVAQDLVNIAMQFEGQALEKNEDGNLPTAEQFMKQLLALCDETSLVSMQTLSSLGESVNGGIAHAVPGDVVVYQETVALYLGDSKVLRVNEKGIVQVDSVHFNDQPIVTICRIMEPASAKTKDPAIFVFDAENGKQVILSSATENAEFYYTTDGTMPTTRSAKYEEPFLVQDAVDLSVLAVCVGKDNSAVMTKRVVVPTTATPEAAALAKDNSRSAEKISLLSATHGATIYYTTDGTEPTRESKIYTEPIVMPQKGKLQAIAVKQGYCDSKVMIID